MDGSDQAQQEMLKQLHRDAAENAFDMLYESIGLRAPTDPTERAVVRAHWQQVREAERAEEAAEARAWVNVPRAVLEQVVKRCLDFDDDCVYCGTWAAKEEHAPDCPIRAIQALLQEQE